VKTDIAVVGGGLIGLATAYAVATSVPELTVTVLEAEAGLAKHQSGRNSGVIHSGVYYTPGSLKAQLCREGARRLVEFCEIHGIAFDPCGKVIVATREEELAPLNAIAERGEANGLSGLRLLDQNGLTEIEPHVSGLAALSVPEAGVVDFTGVAQKLAELIAELGHDVLTEFRVSRIESTTDGFRISADTGRTVEAAYLINCAGLQSDRIARLAGQEPPVQIIPFRGEYYVMPKERDHLVKHLVYPVPDPRFPFLGIHFTRRIDGSVEVGPNAVLALGRHHYRGEGKPSWRDMREMLGSPALWRLGAKYWRTGGSEAIRSRSKKLYAAAARELIPEVTATDLIRGGSGIRAQAVARDGSLADDFVIVESDTSVHVLNAPSPAATACLTIGDRIASRLLAKRR
jgi:L-2-hydroxyglutarate oxidase